MHKIIVFIGKRSKFILDSHQRAPPENKFNQVIYAEPKILGREKPDNHFPVLNKITALKLFENAKKTNVKITRVG